VATKIAARVAISELRRSRWKDYSLENLTSDGELMPSVVSLDVSPADSPHPEHQTERQEILNCWMKPSTQRSPSGSGSSAAHASMACPLRRLPAYEY